MQRNTPESDHPAKRTPADASRPRAYALPHVLEPAVPPPAESRFAIVVSRYNDDITQNLLDGALATLYEHAVGGERITLAWAPGAFELPLIADRLARGGEFAAVICLGAVIQGETLHHEYINAEVARALMEIGIETGVPILFGVLTCRNMEQALARAGGTHGNKGREAALAALHMVGLLSRLSPASGNDAP